MLHHVYLSPGMFGFTRLASYDYFVHVERALAARFRDAGHELSVHVSGVLPTASVRRRAAKLRELIAHTASGEGPVHLVGHSTGGLDARLVASPSTRFLEGERAWLPRLRSVTTMNTPHYGTPLASFFATTKGQQVLYAMSAFTVVGLSVGARPLAVASLLVRILGGGDRRIGLSVPLLDRSVDGLVRLIDDARSPDVRAYLKAIQEDQGAMLQLSPEAMDLMVAGFEDRPGVAYRSTVSASPMPGPRKWLRTLGHPWMAVSLSLFTALHAITSNYDRRYPCAATDLAHQGLRSEGAKAPPLDERTEAMLRDALGATPDLHANDGCVPVRSQIWGTLAWAGLGDHLDVLGHYQDATPESRTELRHHDWLTSGSRFDDARFDSLMDAIADGMLDR